MSVLEVLLLRGGVATRSELVAATSRTQVDRAIAAGDVVVLARGQYALPAADAATAAAHRLHGVVHGCSAALHWGWAVKAVPDRPQVTVAKNRRLRPSQVLGVDLRRANLGPDDVDGRRTSRDRTLLDCLRAEPFDAALAVADSALRQGYPRDRLVAITRDARGPGSSQARRVAAEASGLAANPFESVLRAIAMEVPGLHVRPQVPVFDGGFLGRPDLVDERLRVVLEADSFEWHGGRGALRRDAQRYNAFVVRGWLVLRFAWEDVMFHPDEVARVLAAVVHERTYGRCLACGPA